MADFNFFAQMYAAIVAPILVQMQALIGNVCATMYPIAGIMFVCWLCVEGYSMAFKQKPIGDVLHNAFIAGLALGLLQAAQYTSYVSTFFLQAVPNTVGTAMGGNMASPVDVLDQVLATSIKAAAVTFEALPANPLKSIPLGFGVLVYCVVALASLGYAFAVFMISTITNIVAIVVGPVFIALMVVPPARRFAAGWLGVVVGGCATQVLVLVVIQTLATAESAMVIQVVASSAIAGTSPLLMLWGIAQAGLLLALCTAVVKKIPAIGTSIAGGVYHGAAGAAAATFGTASSFLGAMVGGARGAASAAGKAGNTVIQTARSNISAAGKSLSD